MNTFSCPICAGAISTVQKMEEHLSAEDHRSALPPKALQLILKDFKRAKGLK